MTLSDLANIVEIIGMFAVIFGIVFGILQLRQHQKQSRDMAILELARSFEDPEFTEAYLLITSLDAGIGDKDLQAKGPEYIAAAMRVGWKFETVGMLIYNRVVPMDAMADLVGGFSLKMWSILGEWAKEMRHKKKQPEFFEWYQWLAERLIDRGETTREPAYEASRSWREIK
ncbi:MAG: hypothetical protein MUP90_11645 [Gammaproteobacteria bacterium]|nr:hypothetical protein [Gammaproteobacteria bacterium]